MTSSGSSARQDTVQCSHKPSFLGIPCSYVRIGDLVILKGRPCQVIRITTSSITQQFRYLGVDVFTRRLFSDGSETAYRDKDIPFQIIHGPVTHQYIVKDVQHDRVTVTDRYHDREHTIDVIDQGTLRHRLSKTFTTGSCVIHVLVVSDGESEFSVDMKVVHGLDWDPLPASEPTGHSTEGASEDSDISISQEELTLQCPSSERLRVLCIDGGGVKGYTSLLVLDRIFRTLTDAWNPGGTPPKPCQVFGLIVGTSTGGLIAAMLGRLQMTIAECLNHDRTIGERVFGRRNRWGVLGSAFGLPFYNIKVLQDEIKTVLGAQRWDEEFKEAQPTCKV